MKSNSTKKSNRPPKPRKDFPLTAHPSGHWCKKVNGKVVYFGPWGHRINGKLTRIEGDGWKEAEALYKSQAADLHAGRVPSKPDNGAVTIKLLVNTFITAKRDQLRAGEIGTRMYEEYEATGVLLASTFGKDRAVADLTIRDFEKLRAALADRYGPVRLTNEIQRVRCVFKYGFEAGLIDAPVRYGPQFKKPARRVMRAERTKNGSRVFTTAEVKALLGAATPQLKAMILLGANCGFGNADCGRLPKQALDLAGGWVTFPRPKTGIERRTALWPETIAALNLAIANRPAAKDPANADLVFMTKYGASWAEDHSTVTHEMQKLLTTLGINGRHGLGFYSLRHTFRTVADGCKDFPAVRLVMGHADGSIDAVYCERIDDSRLKAVAEYVRAWLFAEGGAV